MEIIVKIRATEDVPDDILDEIRNEVQATIEKKLAKVRGDRT